MESLWNFELFKTEEVKETYRSILEEQAKYFNESNDIADLIVYSYCYDDEFYDKLTLTTKDGVYSKGILTISYNLDMSKVILTPNEELLKIFKNNSDSYIRYTAISCDHIKIEDKEDFKSRLKSIFTSRYMINLMKNLKRIMGGGISLEKKYTGGN